MPGSCGQIDSVIHLLSSQAQEAIGLGSNPDSVTSQMCDLGPVSLPLWVPVALL